jgi:octaprenyl-diphosphate synthase
VKSSNYIKKLQSFVEADLAKMDERIHRLTKGKDELVFLLSNHLISSGGKRLRPILTIICSKLCGYNKGDRHINLAAAVEFIHTATLLHDDVVDESALRRGVPTANHKWGNKASILVGDFLLSQAFKLMVEDGSLRVLDILSSASATISEGEVMQLAATSNLNLNEDQYIDIISSKTAELFAASCQIGAVVAKKQEQEEQYLRNFGNYLGIAFQMIDDALDYSAKEKDLGKSIGDDFKEGKITLPLIITFSKCNDQEKQFFKRTIQDLNQQADDFEQAIDLINKYNAFDYVINSSKNYIAKAKDQLNFFPTSEAKSILLDILQFSIARTY